jgi:hypothetical protein
LKMAEIWLMNRAGKMINRQRVPISKLDEAVRHAQDRMDEENHSGVVVQIYKGNKFISGYTIYDFDYLLGSGGKRG